MSRNPSPRLRPPLLLPQRLPPNVRPRLRFPPFRVLLHNNLCVLLIRRRELRANSPRHVPAEGRLPKRVRSNRARSRKPRALVRRQARRARSNLFVLCPRETVAQFPELRPAIVIAVQVARVRASLCGRNNPAVKVDVRSHRVPVDPVVLADPAVDVHSVSVRERRLLARVRAPAPPVLVLGCCPRRFPKSRPRRSQASLFTRASRNSASVPWRTSARWKASASCTRPGSVREPAAAEWRPSSRRPNRAPRATSS